MPARRAVCRSSDLNVQPRSNRVQRAGARLLSIPLQDLNDPLSRYTLPVMPADITVCVQSRRFVLTATNQILGSDPCPGFSPDSLVQREQVCVSDPFPTGSRICHKSRSILICMLYYSRRVPPPSSHFGQQCVFSITNGVPDRVSGNHSARKPAPSSLNV